MKTLLAHTLLNPLMVRKIVQLYCVFLLWKYAIFVNFNSCHILMQAFFKTCITNYTMKCEWGWIQPCIHVCESPLTDCFTVGGRGCVSPVWHPEEVWSRCSRPYKSSWQSEPQRTCFLQRYGEQLVLRGVPTACRMRKHCRWRSPLALERRTETPTRTTGINFCSIQLWVIARVILIISMDLLFKR